MSSDTRPPIHPDDPKGPPYKCPHCDGPNGENRGWPTERQRNGHLAAHPEETNARRLAAARAAAGDTTPGQPRSPVQMGVDPARQGAETTDDDVAKPDTDMESPPADRDDPASKTWHALQDSLGAVPRMASLPTSDDAIDATKTVKVKLFDTRNELIAVAAGILAGILWAHYPEFMELALALPAALIGFGGYVAFRSSAIPEWAAVAIVKNTVQYYMGVGFGWGSIRFAHDYVPLIREAFDVAAALSILLF